MNVLRWELQVKHFYWQMLSASIMNCNTAVFTTSYQNLSVLRVAQFSNWLIKLNKLICDACLLDVENAHSS
jgi:hypothetical protein